MHGNGGLFLANFSSFGSDADVTGPGVGIIATVPERFGLQQPYAAMDGTSMASPAVCGALAALLAVSATYQALTGSARAEEARAILRQPLQVGRSGGGVPGKRHSTRAIMPRRPTCQTRHDSSLLRSAAGATPFAPTGSISCAPLLASPSWETPIPSRCRSRASADGLARLEAQFADVLHIERIIPHERS